MKKGRSAMMKRKGMLWFEKGERVRYNRSNGEGDFYKALKVLLGSWSEGAGW